MKYSQRLSGTPLLPWAICKQNGQILACHYTCLAGLNEACTHEAAMLIAVEGIVRIHDAQTVTQNKAYWMLSTSLRDIPYKPVSEIDFAAPRSKQKELDKAINNLTSNNESGNNDESKLHQIKTIKTKDKHIFTFKSRNEWLFLQLLK